MRPKVLFITRAAMIAAIYVALTLLGMSFAYGPIQLRLAEALSVLPALTGAAIPGLTIGCALANLFGPYGLPDLIFGTLATLLASIFAYLVRRIKFRGLPLLAPLGAVVFNSLIISFVIVFFTPEKVAYISTALWIGVSQFLSCYGLGLPLFYILKKASKSFTI